MTQLKDQFLKNQYDLIDTKWTIKGKLEWLGFVKDQKRKNIREVLSDSWENDLRKSKEKNMRAKVNDNFLLDNQELVSKYLSLYRQNKESFPLLFSEAKKENPALTEKEFRNILNESLLLLEDSNYKIDSELSDKEKLNHWWKKIGTSNHFYITGTRMEGINVLYKSMKNWGVIEYIDNETFHEWLENNIAGEQLFDWNAIVSLWLQDKLPNQSVVEFLLKENKDKVLEMFDKESVFPWFGEWIGYDKVWNSAYFFLSNWNLLEIWRWHDVRILSKHHAQYCSVRLLKK